MITESDVFVKANLERGTRTALPTHSSKNTFSMIEKPQSPHILLIGKAKTIKPEIRSLNQNNSN